MTVMVTGGCGLGGSFAVRYALEQGEEVVAFDIAIKTELLNDVKDQVRFVKGDISNASEVLGLWRITACAVSCTRRVS